VKPERVGGFAILRAGNGEWYNQADRGRWDMGEDVMDLPSATWHHEVHAAIRSMEWSPSMVVIDATAMTYLVGQDYGFLLKLSDQLNQAGIRVKVVAPPNEVRAYALLPRSLHEKFQLVAALDEALQGE
jgi:hypothetical protein